MDCGIAFNADKACLLLQIDWLPGKLQRMQLSRRFFANGDYYFFEPTKGVTRSV